MDNGKSDRVESLLDRRRTPSRSLPKALSRELVDLIDGAAETMLGAFVDVWSSAHRAAELRDEGRVESDVRGESCRDMDDEEEGEDMAGPDWLLATSVAAGFEDCWGFRMPSASAVSSSSRSKSSSVSPDLNRSTVEAYVRARAVCGGSGSWMGSSMSVLSSSTSSGPLGESFRASAIAGARGELRVEAGA
jgi:hypothetical protein